jgi:hypothetical protein
LLPKSNVLVAGENSVNGTILATAKVRSFTGSFTATRTLHSPRVSGAFSMRANGMALVAEGRTVTAEL